MFFPSCLQRAGWLPGHLLVLVIALIEVRGVVGAGSNSSQCGPVTRQTASYDFVRCLRRVRSMSGYLVVLKTALMRSATM